MRWSKGQPEAMALEVYKLNPDWYRITYNLAVSQLHRDIPRPDGVVAPAWKTAAIVVLNAAETRAYLEHWYRRNRFEGLSTFLQSIAEPSALILAAGALVAHFGGDPPPWNDSPYKRASMLRALRVAVDRDEPTLSPPPAVLVSSVEHESLKPTIRYNLACYLSQLPATPTALQWARPEPRDQDVLDEALGELDLALSHFDEPTRARAIDSAWKDPTLHALRKDPDAGPRFTELTELYAKPTTESQLGQLDAIRPENAHSLAESSITTWWDLRRLGEPDVEQRLRNAGVSEERLTEWRSLADLFELPGLGIRYANLLRKAGLNSLDGIAVAEVEKLREILRKHTDDPNRVPPDPLLSSWIHWADARRHGADELR
jgi:Domain of unknown function (DUF4332)